MPRGARASAGVAGVLAAMGSACAGPALAAEPARPAPAVLSVLTVADLWRDGWFLGSQVTGTLTGSQAGWLFRADVGGGGYAYRSGQVDARFERAALAVGHRWLAPALDVKVWLGGFAEHHATSPPDPGNRLRGAGGGLRAEVDVWTEPLPGVFAIHAGAAVATGGYGHFARLAAGWRAFDALWLGPEVVVSGSDTWHQLRLGLHATGWRVGSVELGGAAGLALPGDGRDGGYARGWLITRW